MTASFKQMTRDGVLKRYDAHRVHYDDIVIDPSFNTRDEGQRLDEHIQALVDFIMEGGQVPALEVVPAPDGKVKVVDGHCRYRAYGRAIEAGAEIEWIDVRQFQGNDVDRTARIVSSNEGLKLTMLEVSRVYKRLRGYGLSVEDIARKVGKTGTHVTQLLILADAPHAVQQLVQDGTVAASLAIDMVRKHGDAAVEKLTTAAACGGKVTAKAVKPWAPPAKVAVPLMEAADAIVATVDSEAYKTLTAYKAVQQKYPNQKQRMWVTVEAGPLLKLLETQADTTLLRSKAEAKAREKAERSKQVSMEGVA